MRPSLTLTAAVVAMIVSVRLEEVRPWLRPLKIAPADLDDIAGFDLDALNLLQRLEIGLPNGQRA